MKVTEIKESFDDRNLLKIKLFLDDLRDPPDDSWSVVRTYEEAIDRLTWFEVSLLSLDHDLGTEKDGNDVLLWIEEQVHTNGMIPPMMTIHSANPAGRKEMMRSIFSILKASGGKTR